MFGHFTIVGEKYLKQRFVMPMFGTALKDLQQKLTTIAASASRTETIVQPTVSHEPMAAYNDQRERNDADSLCYAPVTNLYFGRSGKVCCCCHNRDYHVGEYPKESIAGIWTGERIAGLRSQLQRNNLSLGCQRCQLDMDRCSYRQVPANHFDRLPAHERYPRMMEFELDTTCNLECTMCNGELSTSIRKNRDKLPPLPVMYGPEFVDELIPYLPHLVETRFSGGEPFLIPIYFQIWEKLVQLNPECLISVQTNGTVLNSRIKAILEKGRFEIGVSLDSHRKEAFERIRLNGSFETVMANVAYFMEYCQARSTVFRLSMCVMKDNWQDLPGFIDLCNSLGVCAVLHPVTIPASLSLMTMGSDKLREALDHLGGFTWAGSCSVEQANTDQFNDLLNMVNGWWKEREIYEAQLEQNRTRSYQDMKEEFISAMKEHAEKNGFNVAESIRVINTKLEEASAHLTMGQHRELMTILLYFDHSTVFSKLVHSDVKSLVAEIDDRVSPA